MFIGPKHATYNAIACLARFNTDSDNVMFRQACDWDIRLTAYSYYFSANDSVRLMQGQAGVLLPTCPTCAVFVDQALEAGMEVEQAAKYREEESVKEMVLESTTKNNSQPP